HITTPATRITILFFSTQPPPTEIYTLSLHDALPISTGPGDLQRREQSTTYGRRSPRSPALPYRHGTTARLPCEPADEDRCRRRPDRKSTRLNSSHVAISYAVFCLKKKKIKRTQIFDI